MLIRFSIENFLSFKERQTFSMIAGKGGRNKKFHLIKKENRQDVSLLKAGVIFGANASGKSNLIKAIDFGKEIVLRGTSTGKNIEFQNFRLDEKSISLPSRIEFEIKHNGVSYAYGFTFTHENIVEEWLFIINKTKDSLVFERNNVSEFNLKPLLNRNPVKNQKQFLEFTAKGTPDNQLFLTEIRNRKVKDNVSDISNLLDVIDWFQNSLTVFFPKSKIEGVEFELEKNTELSTVFEDFLKYFDTGISGISLEVVDFDKTEIPKKIREEITSELLNEMSDKTNAWIENQEENIRYILSKEDDGTVVARKLMTKHDKFGSENSVSYFDINEESDGTQRIIDFIPIMIDLFKGDNVFIVDEMERSLHPNLMYDLIDLFLNKSIGVNSQLILASHESSLITQKLLRKDEIWFVVKDEKGASSLYSLEDYDIRFDKKIRKDYLQGRFKAIPRLGNRNNLSILTP